MDCRHAIEEAFDNEKGILNTKQVIELIYAKYPDKPWKKNTISAYLIGLSVNHPSNIHHSYLRQHAFLRWLGNGRYRRWDPVIDGLLPPPDVPPVTKGPRGPTTRKLMEERVEKLLSEFSECLDFFDSDPPFTRRQINLHRETLEIRRKYPSAAEVLNDDEFFESLYATLKAWRVGIRASKMMGLDEIKNSFRLQAERIREIEGLSITDLMEAQVESVSQQLWEIIAGLRIVASKTKIVAGSKALHHLISSLMPPIDREYTLRFFYNHKTLNQGDERAFREMFPYFHQIAVARREQIIPRIGRGMNTSETKVIDNAIVGFGLKYLKKKTDNNWA